MGVESFNLLLNCSCGRERMENMLDRLHASLGMQPVSSTEYTGELVHPDYLVQMQVLLSGDGSYGVSIRTALCCAGSVVSAMAKMARDVAADLGVPPRWDVFCERQSVDLTSDNAEEVLRDCFVRRRERLYKTAGVLDVPCAARRPDWDCINYLLQFRRSQASSE